MINNIHFFNEKLCYNILIDTQLDEFEINTSNNYLELGLVEMKYAVVKKIGIKDLHFILDAILFKHHMPAELSNIVQQYYGKYAAIETYIMKYYSKYHRHIALCKWSFMTKDDLINNDADEKVIDYGQYLFHGPNLYDVLFYNCYGEFMRFKLM